MKLQGNTSLTELDITACGINTNSATQLAPSLKGLRNLCLDDNKLSNAGAESIMLATTSIQQLYLANNEVSCLLYSKFGQC